MPRYIRINSLKQTFREDLRLARGWKVLFLWIPKLFRKRLHFMSGIPIPVPFQDFVVSKETVSSDALEKLAGPLSDAARLGFAPPVFHVLHTLAGETVTTCANHLHSGGEMAARLTDVYLGNVHPAKHRLAFQVASQLKDGRRLVTTSQRASFLGPPLVIVQRIVDGSLEELVALHRKKLDELRLQSSPERVPDEAALAAFCDRAETEALEFQLRRGLYEEIKPEDAANESSKAAAHRALAGENQTDAAVLTEIDKLNNARGSWRTAFTVGLLSLAAFVALGGLKWSWTFVLILTGVVAFHELGHFVAMRLLQYRDVRMFFVPLLGAAVTGRHYNVKGWQRAVVSLAGPVPGILVGLGLIGSGLTKHHPLLDRVALVSLMVNGINLLPFVPLDGGWVMHAILFSRHFILETAFLAIAGISLIGATLLGWGRLWMYLGILVLVGLPASYRLAQLASRLRSSGLSPASPDAQSIPPETALAILRELKALPQEIKLTKHLASQTLSVFQKLNATPPSMAVSVLLILLYIGAGSAAVLGIGIIYAARFNPFPTESEVIWSKPAHSVDAVEIASAGATNATEFSWGGLTVVATFTNAAEAREAFRGVKSKLGSQESLGLFGHSVFSSPGSNWIAWFKGRGAQVFVESSEPHQLAVVRLSCNAKDETTATALVQDCDAYLNGLRLRLWPPWSNLADLEPERRKAAESLHYTWARLHAIERTALEDPEYKRIRYPTHRFRLKRWTGNEILEEMQKGQEIERAIERRELDKLAHSDDPLLDKQFIELYGRYLLAEDDQDQAWKALEEIPTLRLGSLPLNTNTPAHPQAWRAATTGVVERQKNELRFQYMVFYRTECGLPALVDYLHQHGCSNFLYEFVPPAEKEAGEEESR